MKVYELLKVIPESKVVFYPKADETIFDGSHAFLYNAYADFVRLGIWTNFGLVRRKEKLEQSILECRKIRKNKFTFIKRYSMSNDTFTADTILNSEVDAIHTSYSATKENTAFIIVVIKNITVSDPKADEEIKLN